MTERMVGSLAMTKEVFSLAITRKVAVMTEASLLAMTFLSRHCKPRFRSGEAISKAVCGT